jgi:hypothetical protein
MKIRLFENSKIQVFFHPYKMKFFFIGIELHCPSEFESNRSQFVCNNLQYLKGVNFWLY